MDDVHQAYILAGVRACMIIVGTILAALGHHVEEETLSELTGAITVLAGIAWSLYDKKLTAAKVATAVNVGIVAADRNTGPTPLVTPENAPKLIAIIGPTLPPVDSLPNPLSGHT
jgi:hypothetical protein